MQTLSFLKNENISLTITGYSFTSGNAIAKGRSGYSRDVKCYKDVYREEYIPGTRESPGYVRRLQRKKKFPAKDQNQNIINQHIIPEQTHLM